MKQASLLKNPDQALQVLNRKNISKGCDINEQNDKGYTSLHRAASKGSIEVIKCLLDQGATN